MDPAVQAPPAPLEPPLRPQERDQKAQLFAAETNAEAAKVAAVLQPAGVPLLRAGWPSPEAIDAARPTADWLFQLINGFAVGTRWEVTEVRKVALLEPTAGMIAKYVPHGALPLELTFLVAVGIAYGAPIAQELGLIPKPPALVVVPDQPEVSA